MTSEKDIQTAILKEFGDRPEMRIWRSGVGVGVPINGNRPVQFGIAGQCDISGILQDGRRLEIEVKLPAGRLSDRQKFFGVMISRFNGVWIVARSVDDVYSGLEVAGVKLSKGIQ